jgi:hypothetical protein
MAKDLGQNKDHVWPNFKWEKRPNCKCGMLVRAVEEEKFVFVSNFSDGQGDQKSNMFYIMPLASDGEFVRSDGLPIHHCPWCGDKIVGRKLYPKK